MLWLQDYKMPDNGYNKPNKQTNSPDKEDKKSNNKKGPKKPIGSEISALDFISWINDKNQQDCRPRIFNNITKTYTLEGRLSSHLELKNKINRIRLRAYRTFPASRFECT